MSRRKSRGERILEVLAILLLVAGVALYAYATLGMRALEQGAVEIQRGEWLVSHWARYDRASRIAIGLLVAGIGAATSSLVWFGRRAQPESR